MGKRKTTMVRIHWQDQELNIKRIVLSRAASEALVHTVQTVARERGLAVADEDSEPRPGDFWLGCLPEKGWAASIGHRIGWVLGSEVYLALGWLRQGRPVPLLADQPIFSGRN
jgi:hypothetical protein